VHLLIYPLLAMGRKARRLRREAYSMGRAKQAQAEKERTRLLSEAGTSLGNISIAVF
jgi:hypothetical protein